MGNRKSVSVDESTWFQLKRLALEGRCTLAEVIMGLLVAQGGGPGPKTAEEAAGAFQALLRTGRVEQMEAAQVAEARAMQREVREVRALVTEIEDVPRGTKPSDEATCACGEKWAYHQAGASGTLAARTLCRVFREVR